MATNKNQHFVPRCYLRPFTVDQKNAAINLYNVDRRKFIDGASVRHQCSRDYFYGMDPKLERALQASEREYSSTVRRILGDGYQLTTEDQLRLLRFWLLQYARTEAASKRAVEMYESIQGTIGSEACDFRIGIREAVQQAMNRYVQTMHAVDDLQVCLFRNRSGVPFVTSDDPAVLTNRWYLTDGRASGRSFGLGSSGLLVLLPITPTVLCMGYDGDVYRVKHKNGWVELRKTPNVMALNEHQLLNCRANIFVHERVHAESVDNHFAAVAPNRSSARHKITYLVMDRREEGRTRYRVVDREMAGEHQEALLHMVTVHAKPSDWPSQLRWLPGGAVYTNGSGAGYQRWAWVKPGMTPPYRKENVYSDRS